jgi:hypothetical protein
MNASDCPICMDAIDVLCNRVVTECGHTFHCSCLMQNAAHNGFGCPYCRTALAEEPKEEEEDDEDEESTADSVFEEDALTSFRMFNQRLNGEEVEEEPAEEWESVSSEEDEEENQGGRPDAAYVAQKLMERGITFEDLVKNVLFQEHSGLGQHYLEHERRSSEVYGQFRAVFSQFRPQTTTPTSEPAPIPIPASTVPQVAIPEVADAKSATIPRRREFMLHV